MYNNFIDISQNATSHWSQLEATQKHLLLT